MNRGLEPGAAAAWAIGRAVFYAARPLTRHVCRHGNAVPIGYRCFQCFVDDQTRRVFGSVATAPISLERRAGGVVVFRASSPRYLDSI